MAATYALLFFPTFFVQAIVGQNIGRSCGVINSGYPFGITGGIIDSGLGGAVSGSGRGTNVIGTNDNGLFAYGTGPNDFVLGSGVDVSYCGNFDVSSSSSLAPNGIQVVSDNLLQGPVTVAGQLPFLAAVALGGTMPSGGIGGVSYGSGYSNVGILEQIGSQVGATGLNQSGSGVGINTGLANRGGAGIGYGSGVGVGTCFGNGLGAGYGSGLGAGFGNGIGADFGSGVGTGFGSGSGYGTRFGSGVGIGSGSN